MKPTALKTLHTGAFAHLPSCLFCFSLHLVVTLSLFLIISLQVMLHIVQASTVGADTVT